MSKDRRKKRHAQKVEQRHTAALTSTVNPNVHDDQLEANMPLSDAPNLEVNNPHAIHPVADNHPVNPILSSQNVAKGFFGHDYKQMAALFQPLAEQVIPVLEENPSILNNMFKMFQTVIQPEADPHLDNPGITYIRQMIAPLLNALPGFMKDEIKNVLPTLNAKELFSHIDFNVSDSLECIETALGIIDNDPEKIRLFKEFAIKKNLNTENLLKQLDNSLVSTTIVGIKAALDVYATDLDSQRLYYSLYASQLNFINMRRGFYGLFETPANNDQRELVEKILDALLRDLISSKPSLPVEKEFLKQNFGYSAKNSLSDIENAITENVIQHMEKLTDIILFNPKEPEDIKYFATQIAQSRKLDDGKFTATLGIGFPRSENSSEKKVIYLALSKKYRKQHHKDFMQRLVNSLNRAPLFENMRFDTTQRYENENLNANDTYKYEEIHNFIVQRLFSFAFGKEYQDQSPYLAQWKKRIFNQIRQEEKERLSEELIKKGISSDILESIWCKKIDDSPNTISQETRTPVPKLPIKQLSFFMGMRDVQIEDVSLNSTKNEKIYRFFLTRLQEKRSICVEALLGAETHHNAHVAVMLRYFKPDVTIPQTIIGNRLIIPPCRGSCQL